MTRRQLKDHKDFIFEQLESGYSTAEIAKVIGFHRACVARFATANGFDFKDKRSAVGKKLLRNKDYILAELKKGRSGSSLAKEFKCNHGTLLKMAREHGYEGRAPMDSMKDRVIGLYESGLSAESVGLVVGRSGPSVWQALKRWGISTRPPDEDTGPLQNISLNDLKSNWTDVREPYVVTVGRRPKFYLIPIEG